jgi:hypothetical protein
MDGKEAERLLADHAEAGGPAPLTERIARRIDVAEALSR